MTQAKLIKPKITRIQVYTSPMVDVFNVVIQDEAGTWGETFGSEVELKAFLRGVQAGLTFSGSIYVTPEIPLVPSKRFDEAVARK